MLFNSVAFALFFPVVAILHFLLPHRHRWYLLLAASCGFYMWFRPAYILILAFTIVVDYVAGLWIARVHGLHRRLALGTSIVANVGVLAGWQISLSTWLRDYVYIRSALCELDAGLPAQRPVPRRELDARHLGSLHGSFFVIGCHARVARAPVRADSWLGWAGRS